VDSSGKVFVADTGNKRIVVFTSEGEFITQFGTAGMDLGQLDEPVDVAVDDQGNVYVTDTWNQRVQVFAPSTDNNYYPVSSWEINGWFSQSIENKPFIAVDSKNGYVYVTDPEGFRVLQFDLTGKFLRGWGDYSADTSGFGLPVGITVDNNGKVWVGDTGNNRIMRFDLSNIPLTENNESFQILPQDENVPTD
jgi:DNA-binding beta-propeller fold protein YncE